MQRTIYTILLFSFTFFVGLAQTPSSLIGTIPYDSDPVAGGQQKNFTALDIQAAFTNAHRIEENQFSSVASNSIADWVMPLQADWDVLSIDEQFLFIINEERKARSGIDYGNGPVKGAQFIGLEANVDNLAQFFVDSLLMNNETELDSFKNYIDRDLVIGGGGCDRVQGVRVSCCHEHIPRSALSLRWPGPSAGHSGIFTVEIAARTVYFWLYETNSSSRETILLQDDDLTIRSVDPFGFRDNYGNKNEEGFMGIGIASGPFIRTSSTGVMDTFGHIDYVLLGYFDPIPESSNCNYDCTSCDPCPNTITENSNPIPDDVYQAQVWVESAGTVPASGDVTMKADNFVQLNQQFEVAQGGVFHAYIDDCYFTLD